MLVHNASVEDIELVCFCRLLCQLPLQIPNCFKVPLDALVFAFQAIFVDEATNSPRHGDRTEYQAWKRHRRLLQQFVIRI